MFVPQISENDFVLHVKYVCLSLYILAVNVCVSVCMEWECVQYVCVCANIHLFIHSAINFLFSTSHLFNGALSMSGPSISCSVKLVPLS